MIEQVVPVFPSPVCFCKLDNNFDQDFKKLKENYKFIETLDDDNDSTSMSINVGVLHDFPRLKDELMKSFNHFKNEVLEYVDTEFVITTSWVTKSEKNQSSKLHVHKNSVFSSVLFFDDYDEKTGKLFFSNTGLKPETIDFGSTNKNLNLFNVNSFEVIPQKNLLVIFPSYLMHGIKKHKSEVTRYSLAFNLFPTGDYMNADSSISLRVC